MAGQPLGGTETPPRDQAEKKQLVVVELDKRQSAKRIKKLRKGTGKLMTHIETIVGELVEAGTVKSNAQPVVIVVREETRLPWDAG